MAVAAKRQTYLDQDTNLGVADFTSVSSGIQNGGSTKSKTMSSSAEALISAKKGIEIAESEASVSDKALALVRISKSPTDFASIAATIGQKEMSDLISEYVGDNQTAIRAFNTLGNGCKNLILGKVLAEEKRLARKLNGVTSKLLLAAVKYRRALAKVYNIVNGNFIRIGVSTPCSFSAFGIMTEKVVGKTLYDEVYNTKSNALFMSAIGERSYSIGASNVFETISAGVKDNLGKTIMATSLMSSLSKSGNIYGLSDLSSSKYGRLAKSGSGNISGSAIKNYKKSSSAPSDTSGYWGLLSSALSSIDPEWSSSTTTSGKKITSAKNMDGTNSEYTDILKSGSSKQALKFTDNPAVSTESLLYAATKMKSSNGKKASNDTLTSLQSELSAISSLTTAILSPVYA